MKVNVCSLKLALILLLTSGLSQVTGARPLSAGTGKSNITANSESIHDSLFVKALVIQNNTTRFAIITMDVVTIGRVGGISNDFLLNIRKRLKNELKVDNILVNASHNHLDGYLNGGHKISADVEEKTIIAVKKALTNMEPVKIGAGKGFENRFIMNRRLKTKNGEVFTIRHANPNVPDSEIVQLGDVDPEIGIIKINRLDGTPKALIYNYACHPYTGVPNKGVTAEFPGFASAIIEQQLGFHVMAFFLQGAAGDISEILYKDVNNVRDSEPFGQMLALSTLKAYSGITTKETNSITIITDTVNFPLRTDIPERLKVMDESEEMLVNSLRSTSLNLKTFLPLYIKYTLSPDFPSYYAYRYMLEEKDGLNGLKKLDETNRKDMNKYLSNIHAMENLAEIVEDREILKLMRSEIDGFGGKFISAEIMGVRIGDIVIVTLPAEAFSRVGINVKSNSPFKNTFFAGYTNGYIHYAPTEESYKEGGYEIMSCILAPQWQRIYEEKIREIIKKL